MGFRAPTAEVIFTMDRVAGLGAAIRDGLFGDLDMETVAGVIGEAGRFAEEALVPIDATGDRIGARLEGGRVATAPGWRETYARWRDAGWNGLSPPTAFGGAGLPIVVHSAVQEFWNAGCAAFALGPLLTAGAIDALTEHGSPELKSRYLPKLVAGEWMATMDLTEPGAGSDLAAIRMRAERAGDGTYRLFGEKIFITYGDHDLTPNIIHLVLARLPDAPNGSGGLSLFLAPKRLPDANGRPDEENDLAVARLEKKLGIHASPTCAMFYGGKGHGATAWLVGEENRGLATMFTMMNLARLSVGIQGVGVAERAYQEARDYALTRRQGRASGAGPAAIVEHPDVQAMLMEMKALTGAARAICYACALAIDASRRLPTAERSNSVDRVALLTPIAKAFATEVGVDVANLGIQVHGGVGYVEETGAAQRLRDARIFAIYEGTNGIQAIDLVTRKLRLGNGSALAALFAELDEIAAATARSNRALLGTTAARLDAAITDLKSATKFMLTALEERRQKEALAGATSYLRLFALTLGASLLAKAALADEAEGRFGLLARFFAERILGETAHLRSTVEDGAEALDLAAGAWLAEAG